jgi:hypothetical protein
MQVLRLAAEFIVAPRSGRNEIGCFAQDDTFVFCGWIPVVRTGKCRSFDSLLNSSLRPKAGATHSDASLRMTLLCFCGWILVVRTAKCRSFDLLLNSLLRAGATKSDGSLRMTLLYSWVDLCGSRRSQGNQGVVCWRGVASNGRIGLPYSSLRSIQAGFIVLMSASFLARLQPLSCFSRAIARPGVEKRSK